MSKSKLDMIHKSLKPTKKQLNFIHDIAKVLNKPFRGSSRYDASKYIDNNIEAFSKLAYKKTAKTVARKSKPKTSTVNDISFEIIYV